MTPSERRTGIIWSEESIEADLGLVLQRFIISDYWLLLVRTFDTIITASALQASFIVQISCIYNVLRDLLPPLAIASIRNPSHRTAVRPSKSCMTFWKSTGFKSTLCFWFGQLVDMDVYQTRDNRLHFLFYAVIRRRFQLALWKNCSSIRTRTRMDSSNTVNLSNS